MAEFTINPDRGTLHGHFSREMPPVLTIDSGDTVRFRTLDARWGIDHESKFEPRDEELDEGHALCGPVAIRGAMPGMTLEVRIGEIVPALHGWTAAGRRSSPVNDRMGVVEEGIMLEWTLDRGTSTWRNQFGHSVPARPFMGVMGMPPDEPGIISTTPPRLTGGNIDCKELLSGSTLYLPIAVEGGLFSVGDGHGLQGDGEVSGTAIECPMDRVDLTFHLHRDTRIETPRAHTQAGWITFGFSQNLNEASMVALEAMLALIGERHGIQRPMSLGLASVLVDLRITQVANEVWGVHAVLPDGAIKV
jgi:acetamidase/formamidase